MENPRVRPLPRKVEISKLIHDFLGVNHGYSLHQKPSRLLSGTTSVPLDSLNDALENPGVRPPPGYRYLFVPPSYRMFAPQMVMEDKVEMTRMMRMMRPIGKK
jgi:hypothetical protein